MPNIRVYLQAGFFVSLGHCSSVLAAESQPSLEPVVIAPCIPNPAYYKTLSTAQQRGLSQPQNLSLFDPIWPPFIPKPPDILPLPDILPGKKFWDSLSPELKTLVTVVAPGVVFTSKLTEVINNNSTTIVSNAAGDVVTVVEREAGNSLTVIQKAGQDTVKTVVKGVQDVGATYEKAWKDTAKQAERSLRDIADAGTAVAHFAGNELTGQVAILQNAANQARQGKIIDAVWSSAVSPLHSTEDNFFKAIQESELLSAAAASAAAAYGGPAGAAAFAAWKTFRETGDINMALRMGVLAAITQQGGSISNGMPTGTISEVVKKAAVAGAVGGLAVAAAGGDMNAVTDAFLKSSGNVLIQNGQDAMQKAMADNPQLGVAATTVGCISARNVNCLADTPYIKDATGKLVDSVDTSLGQIKSRANDAVGKWTALQSEVERKANSIITGIPKLPNSNIIPLANNTVVISWTFGQKPEITSGVPTVLITALGDNIPFDYKTTYSVVTAGAK